MGEPMYRLTERMEQTLRSYLTEYHKLFRGARCSAVQLEELLVKAIKQDNEVQHHVLWGEGGHDDKSDAVVKINEDSYPLQINSGEVKKGFLVLSGHRLGRFNKDFEKISSYLNNQSADILSVPYRQVDDKNGRKHFYHIRYVSKDSMKGLNSERWEQSGEQWRQINKQGVEFSLRPSMSWQVWWKIPIDITEATKEFSIG